MFEKQLFKVEWMLELKPHIMSFLFEGAISGPTAKFIFYRQITFFQWFWAFWKKAKEIYQNLAQKNLAQPNPNFGLLQIDGRNNM